MCRETISMRTLEEIRRKAFRRRRWFIELNRMERAIINLTIQCVTEIQSKKLFEIVIQLVDKLREAMKSKVERLMEVVGRPIAQEISGIALSWGHDSASEWAKDTCFLQYLVLIYLKTPLSFQI
jgi:hypothetical protein